MSAPNLDTSRAFQITRISDSVAAEKYTIRARGWRREARQDSCGKERTHSLDAVLKKRLPGACFDLSGGPPTTGKGTSAPTAYVDKDDFYQHRRRNRGRRLDRPRRSATALENGGGWPNLEAARLCVALGNGNAEYRSFFSSHL
ncbi:hypothetical protein B0H17DRAFT_1134625 [Mycena rosella]|uniref:Uncharacterized protein n=1 Tax=Mycena rosella TaxID=1033263 RepID=A0AAD7DF91_MYCRO|nr:hypothetical protein B0H17DRAFT_1134625 [Mycena rosella]